MRYPDADVGGAFKPPAHSFCRLFLVSLLVSLTMAAFTPMTSSWSSIRKNNICKDYCNSMTKSNSGNFNMQTKGWELCFCQAGTTSGEWTNGGCYAQCVARCVSTNGKCANHPDTNNYKGPCCTTANTNATVNTQCFYGTFPGGVPNGDCYQQV